MFGHSSFLPSLSSACTTNNVQILDGVQIQSLATYQLNGNVTDLTGNYNGTASSLTYGTGEFGQAGVFNGSSSSIEFPLKNGFLNTRTTVSVSLWFKCGTLSTTGTLFSDYANTSMNIDIYMDTNGKIQGTTRYSNNHLYVPASTNSYDDNNWHNIVVVVDQASNTRKHYIDGVEIYSGTLPTGAWNGPSSQKITSGLVYAPQDGQYYNKFTGSIDQIRVFNTAVSSDAVSALYAETVATSSNTYVEEPSGLALYQLNWDGSDLSGNYNGTSTALTFGPGKFNDGGIFNGTSSDIDISGTLQSSTMSLSLWVYVNATITSNRILVEFGNGYGLWSLASAAGKLGMQSANSNSSHTLSNATLPSGQWNHVVCVWNSGSRTFYINGATQSGGTVADYLTCDQNTIGSRRTGEFFDGTIDQVRVFNKAITSDEVTTLYEEVLCDLPGTTDTTNYPTGTTNTAYYKLDGDATDTVGTYNGTASNINWTQGRFGSAAGFNGSSSGVVLDSSLRSIIQSNGTSLSLSCWVKTTTTSRGNIFTNASSTSPFYTFSILSEANGTISVFKQIGSGDIGIASSNTYNDNNWHNVVVVFDSTNMTLFIDKSQVAQISDGNAFNTLASDFKFGVGNNNTYFNGSIDQVRIFPTALTAANVTDLYNEVESVPATTDNFGTVLYTGTGAFQTIAGLNFSPGLTWIKNRVNGAFEHCLFDSVRGAGTSHVLSSDTNSAEGYTISAQMTSFNSNGFAVGVRPDGNANILVNKSGENNVAWNWKAGGPAVANGNGTAITSQVSANTNGAFSIVSYTANATSGATVGHGLGVIPRMIIQKKISGTEDWYVYFPPSVIDSNYNYMVLNSTAASGTTGSTPPTTTTFNPVSSSGDYIAYCFASVAGVSKIGVYSGATGTTRVYTTDDGTSTGANGFSPGFIMVKRTDADASGNSKWQILDDKRTSGSPAGISVLVPNTSGAEFGGTPDRVTLNSDGFTMNDNDYSRNASGGTYLFVTFK